VARSCRNEINFWEWWNKGPTNIHYSNAIELTNSEEHSTSWEVNSHTGTQDILFYRTRMINYRVHKTPYLNHTKPFSGFACVTVPLWNRILDALGSSLGWDTGSFSQSLLTGWHDVSQVRPRWLPSKIISSSSFINSFIRGCRKITQKKQQMNPT
jgi:hypothetical protein